jgi:hypothetical protein
MYELGYLILRITAQLEEETRWFRSLFNANNVACSLSELQKLLLLLILEDFHGITSSWLINLTDAEILDYITSLPR